MLSGIPVKSHQVLSVSFILKLKIYNISYLLSMLHYTTPLCYGFSHIVSLQVKDKLLCSAETASFVLCGSLHPSSSYRLQVNDISVYIRSASSSLNTIYNDISVNIRSAPSSLNSFLSLWGKQRLVY